MADITLQQAVPPDEVTHAFDDAIKAREDEVTYENQAEAYARKVESEAEGTIARLNQEATAYKQEVVLQAKGTTARYLALLAPYQAAPAVTSERLYLDAVSSVLSQTSNVFVDNGGDSKGTSVFYLPLEQLLKQHAEGIHTNAIPQTIDHTMAATNSTASTANKSQDFTHPKYPFFNTEGNSWTLN